MAAAPAYTGWRGGQLDHGPSSSSTRKERYDNTTVNEGYNRARQ